jgi:trk system potassium uptake protein TrkH
MKNQRITSLHFAVRFRVLIKYTGQLLLIFTMLIVVCILLAVVVGEYPQAENYAIIFALTGLAGFFMQRLKAPANLQQNEAMVLSAFVFILVPLLVTLPFHQAGLSLSDALFEGVSGITTTGLSTLAGVEGLPKTILFSRAWLQWIGGLGIVVVSVAILLPHDKAALKLIEDNRLREDLITSTKAYARIVTQIYLLLTGFGITLLLLLGVGWFEAVCHVLAAVSTGGFSTYDISLSGLPHYYSRAAVMLLCLLGAVSLGLYSPGERNSWRRFIMHPEIKGLLGIVILAATLMSLFLFLLDGLSIRQALAKGPLLAFSAQSTAGFSSMPIPGLSPGSKLILILMMLVGGNVGSTAGGIKIMRLLIFLKMLRIFIIRRGMSAGAVIEPRYNGKTLDPAEREACCLLILLFLLVIIFSWLPFVYMGYPALDSLFEVTSAAGTVGLSTGVAAPELPIFLKTILCFDMLMGRLEIVAILILFYPPTWFGKKRGDTS